MLTNNYCVLVLQGTSGGLLYTQVLTMKATQGTLQVIPLHGLPTALQVARARGSGCNHPAVYDPLQ